MMLQAVDYDFGPSYEVIILGKYKDPKTQKMLKEVYNSRNLNKIIILLDPDYEEEITQIIPFTEFYFNNKLSSPITYICKNYTCELPTSDLNQIRTQLEQ